MEGNTDDAPVVITETGNASLERDFFTPDKGGGAAGGPSTASAISPSS